MHEPLELDLLNVFVAVAETGSFSDAAERLAMPKSSVSRGIARLEASLGAQLLHRTTRNVGLTTAGAALFERVSPLVASLRAAVGSLPEQQEAPSGTLRVSTATDLATAWLGELLPRFTLRHPDVQLDVRLSNEFVDLVREGYDVALRISTKPLRDSTLVARRLATLELQLFASPAYLARRGTPRTLEDLEQHDFVGPPRARIPPGLRLPKGNPRIATNELSFVREVLQGGGGVGFLPTFLAHDALADGTLVRVVPKYALATGTLYFVHPQMQHVPAKITAFRDFLVEQLALRPLAAR